MICHGDPCKTKSCSGHPDAVCQYDTCTCTTRYYDQFIEVTNECGKYNILYYKWCQHVTIFRYM